jgi:hypothetical protein
MHIIDPASTSAAAARTLAPRPASLRGVTIALLDKSKPTATERNEKLMRQRAEKVLQLEKALFQSVYPGGKLLESFGKMVNHGHPISTDWPAR